MNLTWVSTNHSRPDVYIKCQGPTCDGYIMFNAQEITDRKNLPTNTSTPCQHCGWHPAYPPEPWASINDGIISPIEVPDGVSPRPAPEGQ